MLDSQSQVAVCLYWFLPRPADRYSVACLVMHRRGGRRIYHAVSTILSFVLFLVIPQSTQWKLNLVVPPSFPDVYFIPPSLSYTTSLFPPLFLQPSYDTMMCFISLLIFLVPPSWFCSSFTQKPLFSSLLLCGCGCDLATLYLAAVPLSLFPEHCRVLGGDGGWGGCVFKLTFYF